MNSSSKLPICISSCLMCRWWAGGWDIIWLVWNQPHHTQDSGGQTVPGPKLRRPCLPLHPLRPPAPSEPPHTKTNTTTDPKQWGLCVRGQHTPRPRLTGHPDWFGGPRWPAAVWDCVQRTGQHSGPGILGGRLPECGFIRGCGTVWLTVEEYHTSCSWGKRKPVCGLQPVRQLHPGWAFLRAPAGRGKPHVCCEGIHPGEPLQGKTETMAFW